MGRHEFCIHEPEAIRATVEESALALCVKGVAPFVHILA
jgi:hypothetical protein